MNIKRKMHKVLWILRTKRWRYRKWISINGSIYILAIQGNKQCLIRISNHLPHLKRVRDIHVHVTPQEDGTKNLATILDGELPERIRLKPRKQRKKPQNRF